jgi:hypothetical protein
MSDITSTSSLPPGWTAGAPAPLAPSLARTAHDNLSLPDGRKLGEVTELASALVGLQIPGASHENGRAANAQAYANYIAGIHTAAGNRAVAEWLQVNQVRA